jgi:hypothetical protein
MERSTLPNTKGRPCYSRNSFNESYSRGGLPPSPNLGTMAQFKAAQRFYSKHGFQEVSLQTVPPDLPINPIDTLHYRLHLENRQRN